jgi:hypothetical protein
MEMGHDLKERKKEKTKKKKLLGEDMPLTEGKQEKKKRIVNLFAEDKKIEVRVKVD